jgi:heme-degrading monooxygenase HmoA
LGAALETENAPMAISTPAARTVLEAGFKIIPGKEEGFFVLQAKMVPVAMAQDGFESVYGGPILDSGWLYFGARFASAEQMDAWHRHPHHQAVQRSAYERWWTAVYLRKWREATAGETPSGPVMSETRLQLSAPLTEGQNAVVVAALKSLHSAGAERFETLTGEFEVQPYQFVGPMEIAPTPEGAIYALITHWPSMDPLLAWQQSPAARELQKLGNVTHEAFVQWPETQPRDRLCADGRQREWLSAERPG